MNISKENPIDPEPLISEFRESSKDEIDFDLTVHPADFIFQFVVTNSCFEEKLSAVRYYFEDGKKSAVTLSDLLGDELGFNSRKSYKLLEFASGYGCVSRHLSTCLENAQVTSSDIHPEANQFIQKNFNLPTIQSTSDPFKFPRNESFDVVFALSFFSHMPRNTWYLWLETLYERINSGGYLVFTTQGFGSRKFFNNPKIPEDGFWFSGESSEQKDLETTDYGQTIVSIEFAVNQLNRLTNFKPVLIKPSFWWGHQDLYVVSKY